MTSYQDQSTPSNHINRPGISPGGLLENGIRVVTPQEAQKLVGRGSSGLLIPYHANGDLSVPIFDPGEHPFYRLRRDHAEGDGKYFQPVGTVVHSYLPAAWCIPNSDSTLIAVEGEFKAISLTDSKQAFRLAAVGLPGFFGFHLKRQSEQAVVLTPEFGFALETFQPKQVAFLGDSDTAVNWNFACAAVRLKRLLRDLVILLPRLAVDGPKGIDDCREEYGDKFEPFCRRLLDDAVPLRADAGPDEVFIELLERAKDSFAKLDASMKVKFTKKLIESAAHISESAREQVLDIATGRKTSCSRCGPRLA